MNHQTASDPSALVPPQVLPHVHLVSLYNYPTSPNLQPDQALKYLINGQTIVNDAAPVAWTYFPGPPPDGSVLLTWQSPRMGTSFASDGMVWADPEHSFQKEVDGYTLEILYHQTGFRYGIDSYAIHARQRFRIIRGPTPVDPNLWLVYYRQNDPSRRFSVNQIQIPPDAHLQSQQRKFLEQSGQLVRKEFMLRDRANWPKVEFGQPMPQQRGYYGQMPQMATRPQYYGQPGQIGQPPAKRIRATPAQQSGATAGIPQAMAHDSSIEDEENTGTGDYLDFLTPREISIMRFKQHHEWMEEIISSPYPVGQILPIDLGQGLMGELNWLTKDLLDAPTAELVGSKDKHKDENNIRLDFSKAKDYRKLDPDQLKDFEKRVADYTSNEEAELEKMRTTHAKKMAELKRSRTYIKAERRLKDSARNGSASEDGADGDKLAKHPVVEELEKSLGVEFDTKKHTVCVEKGGFIEEQPAPVAPEPAAQQANGNGPAPTNAFADDGALNGLIDEGAMDTENSAAGLLEQFGGSNSLSGTPGASLSVPQLSQPPSQSQSAVATPSAPAVNSAQSTTFDEPHGIKATSGADDLLDLDVEMSGMTNADVKGGEGDWVLVDQNASGEQTGSNTQPATALAPSADESAVPSSGIDADPGASMFDPNEFGGFDNLDTAGDALADYTNAGDDLGLDLDNSAFGDAFHGTETHHGVEDGDGA